MSSDAANVDPVDPMMRALGDLRVRDPDPSRAARVRARCHAALTGDRSASVELRARARASGWRTLESALVVGTSLAYLVAAAVRAMLLHRL